MDGVREIGVVTSSRADFGVLMPLLYGIQKHPALKLRLIVTGSHLVERLGMSVYEVQKHFHVDERVDMQMDEDTPQAIGEAIGRGIIGFGKLFARWCPDILVILGDRFDMLPAAIAAQPFSIPIAHVSGGELTEGAIDDSIRHVLTQLSHLHFVALKEYGDRVVQMGVEPWRVQVVGALSLDTLKHLGFLSDCENPFVGS